MKKTAAELVGYALEQLPIDYVFGIPGMQNTELYDRLASSSKIEPILVTHESGASFIADGISHSSQKLGICLLVPGAGITNAMSGIAEAYLDGVPMLIISGGTRRDSGKSYQLHQIDQQKLALAVVKKSYLITKHEQIVAAIFEAYQIAKSSCPGPVFLEIPVELQLFKGEVSELPTFVFKQKNPSASNQKIAEAARLIQSRRLAIFAGFGVRAATDELKALAEYLDAPVALTMQGYGMLEGNHPLHCGMSFGEAAVPAATNAFKDCDCLIAVGTRFAEIASGSYSLPVPTNLIHIDIDKQVFNKNYKAKLAIESDAKLALAALVRQLQQIGFPPQSRPTLLKQIAQNKRLYYQSWARKKMKGVNPAVFLRALSTTLSQDDFTVADVGNHVFLMAEHFVVKKAGHFIVPCDFNCMGYSVPASIGVKLAHPQNQVAVVSGDGSFLMTAMEILTASVRKLGIAYFIFRDGELAQISQAQQLPYNRKTATIVPAYNAEGIAMAVGAAYRNIINNEQIEEGIREALQVAAEGQPIIVDVHVSYAQKTRYTKGVIQANLKRFPLADKLRFISRALTRRLLR